MKMISKGLLIAASVALFAPMTASAALIYADFEGNDCSGYFGQGFGACQIFGYEGENKVQISPVIAKYDFYEDGSLESFAANQALYPSVSQSDFTISGSDGNTGSWSTSGSYDAAVDPGVRYWAAKGGPVFRLHWMVEDSAIESGGACYGSTFTFACLDLAQVVTGGGWSTVGGDFGLSHLTLYNEKPPKIVPEPASLLLLSAGLLAVGFGRRRRKHA